MYLDREFRDLLSGSNSVRCMPKLKTVIQNLNAQIIRANQKQSTYNGYHTPGFTMLVNCVYRGATNGVDKFDSDFSKLYEWLEPQRGNISRSFASTGGGGNSYSKYFIYSRVCKEYIFSVEPRGLINNYPLDKGKDAWKRYRAFRMVDVDSNDFTLNVSSGLLNFTRHQPKFCIFTFDPIAAILQYINLKDEVSVADYVHKYLVMPALTLDYIRLWLLGNYNQWFTSRSRDFRDVPMITSSYALIPTNLDNAMRDVSGLIDSSNHMGVHRLLSSLVLPYNTNISKYANTLYNRSSLDEVSEYDWGTFMIYRRLLGVCVNAMIATSGSTDTKTSVYFLRRAMIKLDKGNILSGISDSYIKHFVRESVNTLKRQALDLYDYVRIT